MSDNTYTHGLFVVDVLHMPHGCGLWPAYWMVGPDWPSNGEIDIIEGVNLQEDNSISLHSSDNCTIAGSGQTGLLQASNCDAAENGNSGCGSVLDSTATPNNYGPGFNENEGGYYVTEWTSEYIKHWFFPRGGEVPITLASGHPNPDLLGTPAVNQQGSCDLDSHFSNHTIVINTDFCGAWAGWAYADTTCPQTSGLNSLDSCVEYVGNNPEAFTDAYWEIREIKVFQMPASVATTSAYSTSLSSVEPLASTNTLPVGMGASSTDVSSSAYTGPLSSASSSVVGALPTSATVSFNTKDTLTEDTTPSMTMSKPSADFPSSGTEGYPTSIFVPSANTPAASEDASAVPSPPCGSVYTDPETERDYSVRCGQGNDGKPMISVPVTRGGFGSCFAACAKYPLCVGFTYSEPDLGTCYLKSTVGLYSPAADTDISVFVIQSPNEPSGSQTRVQTIIDSSLGVISSFVPSSAVSSAVIGQPSECQPPIVAPSSSGRPPASPCPSDVFASLCGSDQKSSSCSSTAGKTYDVTCGVVYTGTIIDTFDIDGTTGTESSSYEEQPVSGVGIMKRAIEPNFASCQALCDRTAGCIALNYVGTNCELLSAVTGTSNVQGAVGASVSASGPSPGGDPISTAPPTCPESAGSSYTDLAAVSYGIGCHRSYAGSDIGSPVTASTFIECLPYCDSLSGCVGVQFDTTSNLCYLKSSFGGVESSNPNIIFGLKNRAAPGYGVPAQTVTPSITSTLCKFLLSLCIGDCC